MSRIKYYNDMTGKWEYADKAGSDKDGARYSMTVIEAGKYTVETEDATATSVNIEIPMDGATLERLRKYKAVLFQISAPSRINTTGTVRLDLWRKSSINTDRVSIAEFTYGRNSHKAMLMFVDTEHYAGMVFASSTSSDLAGKTHANTKLAGLLSDIGIVDMSTLSDDYFLEFVAYNCEIGNEITYQVIGLAEEAANFS